MSELRTNRIVPRDGLVSGTGIGGGIVQVKNTTISATDTISCANAGALAYYDSILLCSITPTRADSKILVSFNCSYDNNTSNQRMYVTIYRGTSTNLGGGNGFCNIWNPDQRIQGVASAQYLDSPATTSAVTYHVYGKVTTGDGYL